MKEVYAVNILTFPYLNCLFLNWSRGGLSSVQETIYIIFLLPRKYWQRAGPGI